MNDEDEQEALKKEEKIQGQRVLIAKIAFVIVAIPFLLYLWPFVVGLILGWWMFDGVSDNDNITTEDGLLFLGAVVAVIGGIFATVYWNNLLEIIVGG